MTQPVFFMHIPKTAGTSVNSFFLKLLNLHEDSAQLRFDNKQWQAPDFFEGCRYASGHARYSYLCKFHDPSPFFLFSLIRDPYKQLTSFLNWYCRMADPSHEHYRFHDLQILTLGARLRSIDFEDLNQWKRFLENLDPLTRDSFDNYQTRFFAKTDGGYEAVTERHMSEAMETMDKFDFIGTTDDLELSLRQISQQLGYQDIPEVPRENLSPSDGYITLDNPELRELLKPLVRYDLKLYEAAQSHSPRAS